MSDLHAKVADIELSVPRLMDTSARVDLTASCRDSDCIPKVPDAGRVLRQNRTRVQVMHNGLRVVADGYYGAWMTKLIERCRGHHEPQEEVVFDALLRHVPQRATMLELGGYWAYYSLWFLKDAPQRRATVIEPDPAHLAVGRKNAALNRQKRISFIQGFVGGEGPAIAPFETEESGSLDLPRISVPQLLANQKIKHLDILHCDTQGAELDILLNCSDLLRAQRISFVVLSTHILPTGHDPLLHQRCLRLLNDLGGQILAEHDVHESFSGDGLIAAYFGKRAIEWSAPKLTYNRYSQSYFRNPLFDLAEANRRTATRSPLQPPAPAHGNSAPRDAPAEKPHMISYAQNYEDVILNRVFGDLKQGFYVDVGAADPEYLSVTKWFYDKGWSGINIEPLPRFHEQLTAERPRDINLKCGAGAKKSKATFFELAIPEWSSFDPDAQKRAVKRGETVTKRTVPLLPLNTILDQHAKDRPIDFLKIDVEGGETDVLKGIDLRRYRPTVILVEATLQGTAQSADLSWEPILINAGYQAVYHDGLNKFYLAEESIALKKHFAVPPNVFDKFVPVALHALSHRLRDSEADRAARFSQITELTRDLQRYQAACEDTGKQLQRVDQLLRESETDRLARAEQIFALNNLLQEAEADRAQRGKQIECLTAALEASEHDRRCRQEQIESLSRSLAVSESDRLARAEQINVLSRSLTESERDREARLDQINTLTSALHKSESDRIERGTQIAALTAALQASEEDRCARHQLTESLSKALAESEEDRRARMDQINSLTDALTNALEQSAQDHRGRSEQIETLTSLLAKSEQDRAARLEQINVLTAALRESDDDRLRRGQQIDVLTRALQESEADRAARLDQIHALTRAVRQAEAERAALEQQIRSLMQTVKDLERDIAAQTSLMRQLNSRPLVRASNAFSELRKGRLRDFGVQFKR